MDLIIFCGQSNMQGSTGEKDFSPAVKGGYEYLYSTDEIVPLKNPVGEDLGDKILLKSALDNGSLIPAFCKEYIRLTGKEVVAIHTAKGDSSISEWQKGTERFSLMIEKIKSGIKKVLNNLENVFLVFLQGESDAIKQTGTANYSDLLIKFKNDIKKEVPIKKFCIIKVGRFAEFASWIDLSKKEKRKSDNQIMKAQELAVKKDNDFCILTRVCKKLSVNKNYLNAKEHGPHYNNSGMEIIGKKAGKKLANIQEKL